MKKLKILIVCIIVIIIAIFLIPNPNCYRETYTVSGSKKNYYSIYKSLVLQNDIKEFDVIDVDPSKIYGNNTSVFGGIEKLIINDNVYSFRRVKECVIVTIVKDNHKEELEQYALLKSENYMVLSQKYNLVEYDSLYTW